VHVIATETRDGCPLLSVETEINGDSWSTYEKGSVRGYKRFLSCLGCSSQPSTYIIFLTALFSFISPYRQAAGADSRAGSPVSVSLVITSRCPMKTTELYDKQSNLVSRQLYFSPFSTQVGGSKSFSLNQ